MLLMLPNGVTLAISRHDTLSLKMLLMLTNGVTLAISKHDTLRPLSI